MYISELRLQNFRDYTEAHIRPDPALNVFIGRNAQGKTSLLESIYILAMARSWKAGREYELIKWEQDRLRVSAHVVREESNDVDIEVNIARGEKKQVTVNTIRQTRLADLMGQLNVVLIEPEDAGIVRGEPSARRRFLNTEISQMQPRYCQLLVSYKRVLEQRNSLLRDYQRGHGRNGGMDVWNEQLVGYGSAIVERRLGFVKNVARLAGKIHSDITDGEENLEIKYSSSVDVDGDGLSAEELAERLRERLEEVAEEEMRRKVTLIGPQRDDLVFTINGVDARTYGSQGQQRTVALSLRLAEFEVMQESAGEPPVLLLDDVMTDLDEERRAHIYGMTKGRSQIFMTASSRRLLDEEVMDGAKMWSVHAGEVNPS